MDTIRLGGEVGHAATLDLSDRLDALTAKHRPRIRVDVKDVDLLHLCAVNHIIKAAITTSAQHGDFEILAPPVGTVRALLDAVGLNSWILR